MDFVKNSLSGIAFIAECEQRLLSIILGCEGQYNGYIIPFMCDEMFCSTVHQCLFKACETLYYRGIEINNLSVFELAKNNPKMPKNIGQIIADLTLDYITGANYRYFCDRIKKGYFDRLALNAKSAQELTQAQKLIERYSCDCSLVPISQNADKLLTAEYQSSIHKVTTGYEALDNVLGCFMGGELIILAGGTGMGKSCMGLNLALKIAQSSYSVSFYSLEMSLVQLQNRIISNGAGVDNSKFRSLSYTDEEIKAYQYFAQNVLPSYDIKISDKFTMTIDELRASVKKSRADIIFVDYLGLLQAPGVNKYEKMGEISRSLKILAMEADRPIIALHQLNRDNKNRDNKRPKLSDLRDSGNIEQDADTVCFVFRPHYYDQSSSKTLMEFIIAKNRGGSANRIIPLKYYEEYQRVI